MRKRIEELFGEAKEFMGMRQAKFRTLKFVKEQVLMTATVQNIKRMVKLLIGIRPKVVALAMEKKDEKSFIGKFSKIFYFLFPSFDRNRFLYKDLFAGI